MSWQDIVIAGGNIVFNLALLPSLFSQHKPALATSILTGIVLMIFAYTQYTLALVFASIATAVNGILWLTLAYQKYAQKT